MSYLPQVIKTSGESESRKMMQWDVSCLTSPKNGRQLTMS